MDRNKIYAQIKDYDSIVAFDTETTGLDAQKNYIIELAAVKVKKGMMYDYMSELIKLPEGYLLPDEIVALTHISDQMLKEDGVPEETAAAKFAELISDGKTLLIAYNAQFDLNFVGRLFMRYKDEHPEWLTAFMEADYLDAMTVFKDRRKSPHKLQSAIDAYSLQETEKNTHRAIDDTTALLSVVSAMQRERDDLSEYVNIFGYIKGHGISGSRLKNVIYHEQQNYEGLKTPEQTLPAIIKEKEV